jgi:hypothetical protein
MVWVLRWCPGPVNVMSKVSAVEAMAGHASGASIVYGHTWLLESSHSPSNNPARGTSAVGSATSSACVMVTQCLPLQLPLPSIATSLMHATRVYNPKICSFTTVRRPSFIRDVNCGCCVPQGRARMD